MKVLVINWRCIKNPEAGGAEVYIDEILKRKPAHWNVDFVATRFPGAPETEEINGYTVHRIPNNFLFNFTFKQQWKRRFSKIGYDLVVDVMSKIPLATPNYIQDVPLMGIHYHIHGLSLFKELNPLPAAYVYWMEKWLLKAYKNLPLLLIAESDQAELRQRYGNTDLTIAYCGIDRHFMENQDPLAKSETPTLFYFGRLKKYKRVDHLILAFVEVLKKIPNAQLIIAGKGDDEPRLIELVKTLGLESSVQFLGFISEEEKGQWCSKAWAFAITSEKEGWGIVVIEANAGAVPVVGYNVEGVRNSIHDGYSGFLVENGNLQQLAEKLTLLMTDGNLRASMSQNALEWSRKFDWDKTAAGFLELANRVVETHKKANR